MPHHVERAAPVNPTEIEDLREAVGWDRFEHQYERVLNNSYTHFSVRDGDRLIGFVNIVSDGVGDAFLLDLIVHPDHQRLGIGRSLVKAAIAALTADGIRAIQVTFNPELEAFYRKCGFYILKSGIIDSRSSQTPRPVGGDVARQAVAWPSIMKFGVGIIGATGYIGTPYRAEIREAPDDARIVALCARRRDLLEAAAKQDGCDFITDDWRQVVEHPEVDLVVVATPDALHHEAVMAAAAAGKALFCDKPVGANLAEAYAMWSAYREAKLAHYVPYWSRYDATFRRARELVQAGELGEITGIFYRWHNPRPPAIPFIWRDDATLSAAGSIADVGSHAYDVTRWIVGSEARRVLTHADVISPPKPNLGPINLDEAIAWGETHTVADAPKTRKGTAYDYATITWEWDNDAVGAIVLSHAWMLRKGLAPELELHGSKASLAVDRVTQTVSLARQDQEIVTEQVEKQMPNRWRDFVFPALRERAGGGRSEHPGLRDGWRVQLFTESAVAAAKAGAWAELRQLDAEAG